MQGERIRQVRECLDLFIRSLPEGSFFNIIRFGTGFKSLFKDSVPYDRSKVSTGLRLAETMNADLGGTEILTPLESIFKRPVKGSGVRQIFVLTDGEVLNTSTVIETCRAHRDQNRCFAIGIGAGADSGLIEGIADATRGRSAFVGAGADLSATVISQLELSRQPAVENVNILIEDHSDVQVTPHPIGSITPHIAFPIYLRSNHDFADDLTILLTGNYLATQIDHIIETGENCENNESISRCLRALFAFETIRSLEQRIGRGLSQEANLREQCISVSLESGVLCRETAFVGFSNGKYQSLQMSDGRGFFGVVPCPSARRSLGAAAARKGTPARRSLGAAAARKGTPFKCDRSIGDRAKRGGPLRSQHNGGADTQGGRCPTSGPSVDQTEETDNPWHTLDLRRVTSLQSLDGSWQDVQALFNFVERRIDPFPALPGDAEGNAIFATIVALAVLRVKFQHRAAAWRMIERKALTWLSGRCDDFEEMIDEAVHQLSN
jgi:hypothetical protein